MTRARPTVDTGEIESRVVPHDTIVTFEVGEGRHVQVWQDDHGDVHVAAACPRGGKLRVSPVDAGGVSVTVA